MTQMGRIFGDVALVSAAAVPIAVVIAAALTAYRSRSMSLRTACARSALDVLVALAVVPVVLLIATPGPYVGGGLANLTPGAEFGRMFGSDAQTSDALQAVIKVALLLPLGALLPLRFAGLRTVPRMLAIGFGLAVISEFAQFALLHGGVATTDAVILKTAGAVIGAAATYLWWNKMPRPSTSTRNTGSPEPSAA